MNEPFLSLLAIFVTLALLYFAFRPETGWHYRWQQRRRQTDRILMEDALKHVFTQQMENRQPGLDSIAGALSTGTNKAAEVAGRLENLGLLFLDQGELRLTEAGRSYALRVIRAHRLWESHLSENTGYAETEWHQLAEQEEHSLSPQEADALAGRLGYPSHDPHGDPIPTSKGEIMAPDGRPLTGLPPNQPARIVHIEDEPPVIYSQLVAEGLHTGMVVTLLDETPQRVRFWSDEDEYVLAPLLAKNISVMPIREEALPDTPGRPLSDLVPGQSALVTALAPAIRGAERRRLMDLGILPGTTVRAELQSPNGDPTAYLVRGALIALRADQAKHIKIKTEDQIP